MGLLFDAAGGVVVLLEFVKFALRVACFFFATDCVLTIFVLFVPSAGSVAGRFVASRFATYCVLAGFIGAVFFLMVLLMVLFLIMVSSSMDLYSLFDC